jgi:hypothetical protein
VNPFSILTSKIYAGLAIFFMSLALLQTVRIEGFLFIDGYKETLAERDKTIADIAAAQAQADIAQAKMIADTIQKYKERANEADTRAAAAASTGRAAADRYAVTHRVRADALCARQADTAPTSPAAPPADGPGALPDMVAMPRKDYDILTANTTRLDLIVNDYVAGMIRDNLAVPDVGF